MTGNSPHGSAPESRPRQRFSRRVRQEAFDLYCSGLSRREVGQVLGALHSDNAPGDSTLKRWAANDRWTARRRAIQRRVAMMDDHTRAVGGTLLMTELRELREAFVTAGSRLPFRSAEGAARALAAVQRIIDRMDRSQTDAAKGLHVDGVIDTMLGWLQEDEVLGPLLARRRELIMRRVHQRLEREGAL